MSTKTISATKDTKITKISTRAFSGDGLVARRSPVERPL